MVTPIEVPISAKAMSNPPRHPLDPLEPAELEEAVQILGRAKHLGETIRICSLNLIEPAKASVETHAMGSAFERKARAVLLDRGKRTACEVVVDLKAKSISSVTELPSGVQPSIMLDEFSELEQAVHRSPLFQEALKKRGVTNANLVMVEPWSAGMYGTELPEDKGIRRMRALCFVRSEPTDNGYARPIDSMVIVVDLYKMEVVRIEEYPIVSLPPEPSNWAREYIPKMRADLKPVEIVQPEGVSFTVTGNQVEWQKWKFRVGFTSREGLVLYTVSYNDDGVERPILYRASICEMVVPYGDPGEQYYRKNAFDIGEYGLGMLANSLALGCDCLGVIYYFDFPLVDSRGNVTPLKNAVCLHEERLRNSLEAHRLANGTIGSSAVPPAVGFVHCDGGELRIWILLVFLSGWVHPVRDQADGDYEHHGAPAWRKIAAWHGSVAAVERALSPAYFCGAAGAERGRRQQLGDGSEQPRVADQPKQSARQCDRSPGNAAYYRERSAAPRELAERSILARHQSGQEKPLGAPRRISIGARRKLSRVRATRCAHPAARGIHTESPVGNAVSAARELRGRRVSQSTPHRRRFAALDQGQPGCAQYRAFALVRVRP